MIRCRPVLVAFALFAVVGCGPAKLNESRSLALDSGEAKAIDLPAVSKAQNVTVEFTSSAGEVTVFLFSEADAKGGDGLLLSDPKKALGQKQGKEGSFTAEVPANTPARVIVRKASAKTEVNVKVTNKQ